jgi:hypothetical protein
MKKFLMALLIVLLMPALCSAKVGSDGYLSTSYVYHYIYSTEKFESNGIKMEARFQHTEDTTVRTVNKTRRGSLVAFRPTGYRYSAEIKIYDFENPDEVQQLPTLDISVDDQPIYKATVNGMYDRKEKTQKPYYKYNQSKKIYEIRFALGESSLTTGEDTLLKFNKDSKITLILHKENGEEYRLEIPSEIVEEWHAVSQVNFNSTDRETLRKKKFKLDKHEEDKMDAMINQM